jgi:hypothetical protein
MEASTITGASAGITTLAALHTVIGAPLAMLVSVAAALGLGRRKIDAHLEVELEGLLAREAEAFRQSVGDDLLDFRTTAYVHGRASGTTWGWVCGNVKIVRTVRAALGDGYRVRLRAYARGACGRVLVRCTDVELRHAA